MNKSKWIPKPIFLITFSILTLIASFFFNIYWYLETNKGLKKIMTKSHVDQKIIVNLPSPTWLVILVLSVLVILILTGIFLIYLYYLKTSSLYKLQNNFINNFTHELKTPVTSLKLYLETFLKHELSREAQNKYLNYMIMDVNRLSDNINGILNLGRIESKSFQGEFILSELIQIIERFLKINAVLFKNCKIKVHNLDSKKYMYKINLVLFEMLLMNIITNALKYNKSDKPKIDISFEEKNGNLQIKFKDNGIGLKKSELKNIFKKFKQVDQSTNLAGKGNGLGLYLVKNIVRIHKWKVKAESAGLGYGIEINLILPLN